MKQETRNKKQETRNKKQEIISSSDNLCQGIELIIYKNAIVVNPDSSDERISRTIKSQYYKNSVANIFHHGTFGCTGIIQITESKH